MSNFRNIDLDLHNNFSFHLWHHINNIYKVEQKITGCLDLYCVNLDPVLQLTFELENQLGSWFLPLISNKNEIGISETEWFLRTDSSQIFPNFLYLPFIFFRSNIMVSYINPINTVISNQTEGMGFELFIIYYMNTDSHPSSVVVNLCLKK